MSRPYSATVAQCDLTSEEKLSLLKCEFDQITSECIEDALRSFAYDYETTRTVIAELFPRGQGSFNPSSSAPGPGADEGLLAEPSSLASSSDLLMEISPSFFARLQAQFEGTDPADYECLPSIAKDFETQGALLLPLDSSAAQALYRNILQFVRQSNAGLRGAQEDDDDDGLGDVLELSRDVHSPTGEVVGANLREIMELEAALKASREEYVCGLSRLASNSSNSPATDLAAISQELVLEKKRSFLAEKFPGVNELHLSNLFEINCFNLNETIKDIEAIYHFKLPNCYRHSLYCEAVKRSSSDSGFATESTLSDEDSDSEACEGQDSVVNSDKEFTSRAQSLFEERKMARVRIAHLRVKSAHFSYRKQPNAAQLYQQEIARCNLAMKAISESLIQLYVSYGHPSNSVDLHGLIMKEVSSIVPEMLRRKQSTCLAANTGKRLKFKVITGIGTASGGGASGLIRNFVLKLLLKKNMSFQADGPGAFIIGLSSRHLIDF